MQIQKRFYEFLIWLGRYLGYRAVSLFVWFVSTGYFVFFPRRVATSIRFYQALFNERRFWRNLARAWRQFHHFGSVYVDRLRVLHGEAFAIDEEGLEVLKCPAGTRGGGLLLTTHLGNWELGTLLLRGRLPAPLMIYIGSHEKEQIEKRIKADLAAQGFELFAVSRENPSPLDLLPAVNALRRGEYVAIAADRRWVAEQQLVDVQFAGHRVSLPAAPFALPHLGRAPVYQFFALRTGPNRLFAALIPLPTEPAQAAATRAERIQTMAQAYADHLEAMARRFPESWYHFEPFLGPRVTGRETS